MTANTDRLKTEEILKINRELAKRGVPYTGLGEYPVREDKIEALVKNAPDRDPTDIAAYYLKNLTLLQAFPDGNHRTALVAARIFLKRNGYDFYCTEDEAEKLRNYMLDLQFKLYGTYEELPETVTQESNNEIFQLCRDFIREHTTPARPHVKRKSG